MELYWLHILGEGKGMNEEETVKCVFEAKRTTCKKPRGTVMMKTLKGLVLYLKKDKPLKRLRWEVAATISLFGKVSLAAGSFVQGFPRTVHGVSTWCPPNKESSWTECHILTGHHSKLEKAASS